MISKETEKKLVQMSEWFQSFPQIGGITKLVDVDVVVDTSAYASGDVIYQLLSVPVVRRKGGSGVITSVEVIQDVAGINMKVFAFTDIITVAADNTAFAPTMEDLKKLIPMSDDGASVNLSTWETVGSFYVSSLNNINAPFNVASDKENVYFLLVANGAITWSAANDVHLRVGFLLD
jgi:hypothetical protein